MTNFLIKIFIKDYTNINNNIIREKYGVLGSIVGIISNISLFLIKLIIGIVINSTAITADAFNNLADTFTSIITLFGFKLASKPPDKEHPFGHGRIEYITSFIVSIIIILIGVEFLQTSFKKVLNPEDIILNNYIFFILLITIGVKIWQANFNKKLGTVINSKALIASSIDSKNDVIITFISIVSLIIFKLIGINLDGQFGIIVAIFLIYTGINLSKEMLSPLLGEAVSIEIIEEIRAIVLSYEPIIGVHDIFIHNYGPNKNIASLHVEIRTNMSIGEAHEIIDEIERKILEELGFNLTIHIDPIK